MIIGFEQDLEFDLSDDLAFFLQQSLQRIEDLRLKKDLR